MKKNNGFTLVELLAVITILGLLMVIGGTAITKVKKDANIKEAKQIEEMLKDLGPGIYSYEKSSGIDDEESHCTKELKGTYSGTSCSESGANDYTDFFNYKYQDNNNKVSITFQSLYNAGYLKEVVKDNYGNFIGIKNPSGGNPCTGYLTIEDADFKVCLRCPGIAGYDDSIIDPPTPSCPSQYDKAELTK